MATVRIPASLRTFTQGQEDVQAPGATVGEVINNLEPRYPGLKSRILDDKGALRRYVNLFHNDEDVRFLQALATPVKDADKISVIPAIAGG